MEASDVAASVLDSLLAAFGRRIRPARSPAAQQRSFRVRSSETKAAGRALSSVTASGSVALDHGPDKQVGRSQESENDVWLDLNSGNRCKRRMFQPRSVLTGRVGRKPLKEPTEAHALSDGEHGLYTPVGFGGVIHRFFEPESMEREGLEALTGLGCRFEEKFRAEEGGPSTR
ncbi:hypothetical protein CCHR01_03510 [Colletotrichum chrysophilum]|uniref:Uncharacterized protein n=1 Tax=Colletotrichum chrysophilum TaxID=1836956 RepID=A0AAD9AUA1_9PEZI|nr:hypothetical protein CCHR01_03510 [Colletotrichum chrysophilum]